MPSSVRTTRPPRAGGFTIVEIITVMAIIAILVTFSLYGLQRLTTQGRLQSANLTLIAELRGLRSRAMATGKIHALRIDLNDNYTILRMYRFEPVSEPLAWRTAQELWENLDDQKIIDETKPYSASENKQVVKLNEIDMKQQVNVWIEYRSDAGSGADKAAILFLPDGSCNDGFRFRVIDRNNLFNASTGNFDHPDQVFDMRLNRYTGLPDTVDNYYGREAAGETGW